MKRLSIFTVVFLFLLSFASAHQGLMTGEGKLRVAKTRYFDIIYGEKSSVSAAILYENADAILEELAAAYGKEPDLHLPVVITSGVEQFNAYYTYFPFDHIVIHDTGTPTDLSIFSQTFISVFTHELTHAFTHNLKSPFYKGLSNVLGDAFSFHYLTVTGGIAESASVTYESSKGEGRLNDPYSMQSVRQAKIENKFPSYSDVKGAGDIYPLDSYYHFNAAFAEFLQTRFGMEKYAEFWYCCVNVKNITAAGAFKKTYGVKLDAAWKQFRDSYPVPSVGNASPVAAGYATDYFDSKNNSKSLFSNLCVSSEGLIYLDEQTEVVFLVPFSSDSRVKPKKLFVHKAMDSIKVCADGRFMTVGYYTNDSSVVKHSAGIYDLKEKRWFATGKTGITNPAVVSSGKNYFFVYRKYEEQKYIVCVEKVILGDKGIKALEPYSQLELPQVCDSVFDLTDMGNGSFAFIHKAGLNFSICVTDPLLTSYTEYSLPLENMRIRNLSFAQYSNRLVFSWAQKETMPRLGILDLNKVEFLLSDCDISGGVYTPVLKDDTLVFTGHFFRQNRLFTATPKLLEKLEAYPADTLAATASFNKDVADPIPEILDSIPYEDFSPWDYAFKGLIVPLSILKEDTAYLPLGISYVTALPWDTGHLILTGGYGIKAKTGGFGFEYLGGTDTNLFKYTLSGNLLLNNDGFKSTNGTANLQSSVRLGKRSTVSSVLQAGVNYNAFKMFMTDQTASLTWSNAILPGPNKYGWSGVGFSVMGSHKYSVTAGSEPSDRLNTFNLGAGITWYIPKFIPLRLNASFVTAGADVLDVAAVSADSVLFACEIQKAVPVFTVFYINELVLRFKYSFTVSNSNAYKDDSFKIWDYQEYLQRFKDGTLECRDTGTLKLCLNFTPNAGIFAVRQLKSGLYLAYNFSIMKKLTVPAVKLGLETSF